MSAIAKLRGERLERGDVLIDRDGRRWKFDFVTRQGKVVCAPERAGVPGVLDPQLFPGLSLVEA